MTTLAMTELDAETWAFSWRAGLGTLDRGRLGGTSL